MRRAHENPQQRVGCVNCIVHVGSVCFFFCFASCRPRKSRRESVHEQSPIVGLVKIGLHGD